MVVQCVFAISECNYIDLYGIANEKEESPQIWKLPMQIETLK